MSWAVFALGLSLWVSGSAAAQSTDTPFVKPQASIQGIVVSDTVAGMMGQAVDIIVTVTPRDQSQTRFERGVGDQMVTSLNEAVRAVQVTHPQWDGSQLRVSFENKYSSKDGGSAGSAYAVCFRSLLEGFDIDPGYAMTGDITVDQRVRQIGGVSAKIRGATADGAKIVGIPIENTDALEDMLLLESPQALLETQVFVLETLDEAVGLARIDRDPLLQDAIDLFEELRESVGRRGYKGLRTADGVATLTEIVALAPHHASADLLLRDINNDGPRHLSVTGSLNAVLDRGRPSFEILDKFKPGQYSKEDRDTLRDAMTNYVSAGNALMTSRKVSNRQIKRFNSTVDDLIATYNEVSEDADTIEAMMRGE